MRGLLRVAHPVRSRSKAGRKRRRRVFWDADEADDDSDGGGVSVGLEEAEGEMEDVDERLRLRRRIRVGGDWDIRQAFKVLDRYKDLEIHLECRGIEKFTPEGNRIITLRTFRSLFLWGSQNQDGLSFLSDPALVEDQGVSREEWAVMKLSLLTPVDPNEIISEERLNKVMLRRDLNRTIRESELRCLFTLFGQLQMPRYSLAASTKMAKLFSYESDEDRLHSEASLRERVEFRSLFYRSVDFLYDNRNTTYNVRLSCLGSEELICAHVEILIFHSNCFFSILQSGKFREAVQVSENRMLEMQNEYDVVDAFVRFLYRGDVDIEWWQERESPSEINNNYVEILVKLFAFGAIWHEDRLTQYIQENLDEMLDEAHQTGHFEMVLEDIGFLFELLPPEIAERMTQRFVQWDDVTDESVQLWIERSKMRHGRESAFRSHVSTTTERLRQQEEELARREAKIAELERTLAHREAMVQGAQDDAIGLVQTVEERLKDVGQTIGLDSAAPPSVNPAIIDEALRQKISDLTDESSARIRALKSARRGPGTEIRVDVREDSDSDDDDGEKGELQASHSVNHPLRPFGVRVLVGPRSHQRRRGEWIRGFFKKKLKKREERIERTQIRLEDEIDGEKSETDDRTMDYDVL